MTEDIIPSKRERLLKLFTERGFAFVHIPKTAGFSLTKVLLDGTATEHTSAGALRLELGPCNWQNLFTFAFVRHPLTRFISAFRYLKAGGMNTSDQLWAQANLQNLDSAEQLVLHMLGDRSISEWVHFRPQVTFICDKNLAPLVNFIGRFETIDVDFAYVCERLGLHTRLPTLNRTPAYHEKVDSWSAIARRAHLELYRQDYELFGY